MSTADSAASLIGKAGPWSALRGPFYVTLLFLLVAASYWPTMKELAGLGERSDTHFAFVGPAFAYLVWSQRERLYRLPVQPFYPALAAIVLCGLVWLLGELIFMRILSDTAMVVMVPLAVLATLGTQWVRALAFPLAFLLFAVPFWSPLVPALVEWTANALHLGLVISGVPVRREGAFLSIPTGDWAVADACSGVEYLSACVMLGVLIAHALFLSPRKRIGFILVIAAVGVFGNWLRAYLTVLIAHLSDNRYLREDHGTFGWVLYAVLLVLVFRAAWKYRDDWPAERPEAMTVDAAPVPAGRAGTWVAATVLLVAIWPLGLMAHMRGDSGERVAVQALVPAGAWREAGGQSLGWVPKLHHPVSVRQQSFHKDGKRVDVFIGLFQNQTWHSKLVNALNRLVDEQEGWVVSKQGQARVTLAGKFFQAASADLVSREGRVLVWHWYWVAGTSTSSGVRAKLQQLQSLVRTGSDGGAWVSVAAEASQSMEDASALLQDFLRDMGPALDTALTASSGQ